MAGDEILPEIRGSVRRLCAGLAEAFDNECELCATRLYQIAPVPTNLILPHVATHVLRLQKSF